MGTLRVPREILEISETDTECTLRFAIWKHYKKKKKRWDLATPRIGNGRFMISILEDSR